VIAAAAEVAALLLLAPPMATEVVTELPTWAAEPPEEGSSPLDCCRRMDMDLPSSSRIMTL
jgi:hypothetical protein